MNALVVVDEQVFLLRNSKHSLVLEEADVTHDLLSLELTNEVLALPVHEGDMAASRAHQQMPTIATEVKRRVGPEILQIQVEHALCVLNRNHFFERALCDFQSPLVLIFHLQITSLLSLEELTLLLHSLLHFFFQFFGLTKLRLQLLVLYHFSFALRAY